MFPADLSAVTLFSGDSCKTVQLTGQNKDGKDIYFVHKTRFWITIDRRALRSTQLALSNVKLKS
jgi:hypothetical protein